MNTAPPCRTCADVNRRGYCAPLRCYCGHKDCHAAASYYEPTIPDVSNVREKPTSTSWANRKESTWIDQM